MFVDTMPLLPLPWGYYVPHTQRITHNIRVSHSYNTYPHLGSRGSATVATGPHVPERAIGLIVSSGGRRDRHHEVPFLGHSPQPGRVHLNIVRWQRRRRGGRNLNSLFLFFGHSSGRRTADEISFSRSELIAPQVRHPDLRYHDSSSMIHGHFKSKVPLFPVFPVFLTRRKLGESFIYGKAGWRFIMKSRSLVRSSRKSNHKTGVFEKPFFRGLIRLPQNEGYTECT